MKNLNVIKWLLSLADGKPLIFSIAILLIAISAMGAVIVNRDSRLLKGEEERKYLITRYEHRIDSLNSAHEREMNRLNIELKTTLRFIIEDSKEALEEQKALNEKIDNTIQSARKLVKVNRSKLKFLTQ